MFKLYEINVLRLQNNIGNEKNQISSTVHIQ